MSDGSVVRIDARIGGPQPAVMVGGDVPKTYMASLGYELVPDRGGPWQNTRSSNCEWITSRIMVCAIPRGVIRVSYFGQIVR